MMVRKSNSGGCGCGKPKCSGCNSYRPGGMVKRYAAGGPVKGDPRKEVLATIASLVAADNAAQESGTMTAPGSEKSTDVVMPGIAAALRALKDYEKPPEDIDPIEPTSPTVIKEGVPPPTFKEGVPPPTFKEGVPPPPEKEIPADFGGSKGSLTFRPEFGGDISQTRFRGPGTTGALTGAFADIKNPDGTMDRVKTRLSDMPEYITKDPYFTRLVDIANKKHFNLEREKGSIGGAEAAKTPEAKLIARILNGDITLEQAKKEANFQSAAF